MRAALLTAPGEPPVVAEVRLNPVRPGEVRVRMAASGVCHTDLSIVDGGMPQGTPAVLGHEGAGVVAEVGAAVTRVAPGDHVVLSWVAPCRACAFCLRGQPELCERGMDHAFGPAYAAAGDTPVYAALGTATLAEETVVPEQAAVRVDPDLPLDLAALMGCAVLTGVGAVTRAARLRPGETAAVVGCGGVGLAAIQGARLAGASRIVALDVVPGKLALARANGATDTVAAGPDSVAEVRALTDGRGVDHAFEVVGAATTISLAYSLARRGGTVTVVGAGGFDDPVSFPALSLMADAKRIVGSVYGGSDPDRDVPELVALQRRGAIDVGCLVSKRIPLDEVVAAFADMRAGRGARNVVVFDGG